jgi:hypothetical protein
MKYLKQERKKRRKLMKATPSEALAAELKKTR